MTAGPLGKIGYQKIPAERTFDYNFQVGCSQNIGKLVKSHTLTNQGGTIYPSADLTKPGWTIAHPTQPSPTPLPIVAHSMAIVNLNKVEDFMINRNTTAA